MSLLIERIKNEEGFRGKVYTCSAGKLTIGYGWNLEDNDLPDHIACLMLMHHINYEIKPGLAKYDWYRELDDVRKQVIIDMAYQMGVHGVMKFGKMISAIKYKYWDEAAKELLDSRYAAQTPERAHRNAEVMLTGSLDCIESFCSEFD